MTKSEIEAFLAVVQYGSISAAAEQIYVTQPALTRRIQNLEKELEYRLFTRGKGIRGSSLTRRGQAFLPLAQRWNEVYREAVALQGIDSKPTFRLASIGSASRLLVPEVFRAMTAGDTPYYLEYHLCHSVEGYSLVEKDLADVVLIDYLRGEAYSTGTVLSTPVYSVPFVVVGGAAWRDVKRIRAAELDVSRELTFPWNLAFDAWHGRCFDPGIRPVAYLDDAAAIEYILRDDLFAIVPRTEGIRLSRNNANIFMLELEGGPPDEIIHCLTSPLAREQSAVRFFFEIVKTCCAVEPGVRCLLP